jgi:tRNA nucleotidyltransferase (CCA-adding enzyme)
MPDYVYLLENRLSADQKFALTQMREAARAAGMILFLTGDAVRDLTSGHAVRDLEVAVHGNALKLKKSIEHLGGSIWGESESTKSVFACFPGTVRVDVVSTHRMDYTRLEKPVYHADSIHEDLRRRDFTVNAMAISLNEGSYGLLMDPLNGAADIEARTLRLVSNYGFLEEPSLLIRATRYLARLGWEMDPKTRTRYDNAKDEGVIDRLSAEARSRELEQIGHEDDGLKILRALEDEGWMKFLDPAWTVAKADEEKLKSLHELTVELLVQGVHPDMSAAQMQLLTAKLSAKDLAALKHLMLRPGFVEEWNSLDAIAAKFAKVLLAKENATASACYKLFTSYDPEAVLWLGFTSKDKAVQERYHSFEKVWPEARQRIPHALMQEMRITPELPNYKEIVHAIFLELIDGHLTTPEETRAFLEPHSPPAPPPKEVIKRPRAKRGEAKAKERSYDEDEESEDGDEDEDLDDLGGDDDEIDLGLSLPKDDLDADLGDEPEPDSADEPADDDADSDDSEPEPEPTLPTKGGKAKKGEKSDGATSAGPPGKASPAKGNQAAAGKPAPVAKAAPKAEAVKAAGAVKGAAPAKIPAKMPDKIQERAAAVKAQPAVNTAKAKTAAVVTKAAAQGKPPAAAKNGNGKAAVAAKASSAATKSKPAPAKLVPAAKSKTVPAKKR